MRLCLEDGAGHASSQRQLSSALVHRDIGTRLYLFSSLIKITPIVMLILLLVYSLTQSGFGDGAPISAIERRELSTCNDLNSCRTLSNIVWSCLTTIFLCTWVAIHPNIMFTPEEKNPSWLKKRVWKPMQGFLTYKLPLFLVALLVPEYILAWAIRQYVRAGRIQVKYKDVSGWTRTHGFFVIMGGFHLFEIPTEASPKAISSNIGNSPAPVLSHLHLREDEVPKWPLGIEDLPADLLHTITPTESELKDKGKSDALTKFIVIIQTLWFVGQCIVRGTQHLPLTELEVVTLAYATMNFFIYVFWWDKPRDVACPIRVYKTIGTQGAPRKARWYETIFLYIMGAQEKTIILSQERKVPMFWSDSYAEEGDGRIISQAYLGPAILGMGFGAIHFIAWSSEFPSHIELMLWRVSCVAMTVVPLLATLFCIFIAFDLGEDEPGAGFFAATGVLLTGLLGLTAWLYIVARIATIVIAFTTLRSLPSAAYTVVDWTTFIPHI